MGVRRTAPAPGRPKRGGRAPSPGAGAALAARLGRTLPLTMALMAATDCAAVLGIGEVNRGDDDDDASAGAAGVGNGGRAGRAGGAPAGQSGAGGVGGEGPAAGQGGAGPGGGQGGAGGEAGQGGGGLPPAFVVINEIFHNPPGTDLACFVELFGTADASLEGFELRLVQGFDGGVETIVAFDGGHFLGPTGFFVVRQNSNVLVAPGANSAVSEAANTPNSANSIVLVRADGVAADAVAYSNDEPPDCPQISEGEGAGCATAPPSNNGDPDRSLGRDQFSADTQRNANDFSLFRPSPGSPNLFSL